MSIAHFLRLRIDAIAHRTESPATGFGTSEDLFQFQRRVLDNIELWRLHCFIPAPIHPLLLWDSEIGDALHAALYT